MKSEDYNSLSNFVSVFEGNKKLTPQELKDLINNAIDAGDVDPDDLAGFVNGGHKAAGATKAVRGKDADKNGSGGRWDVDRPDMTDLAKRKSLREDTSENFNEIYTRVHGKGKDFCVLGDAGWAKTTLIGAIAKMCGWSIITVYLDKADVTDLGGIPTAVKGKGGDKGVVDFLLPAWANIMLENPDEKFLLFFDEFNQASQAVINALMPIILGHTICGVRFDNFIVGMAGNERTENSSVKDVESNKAFLDRVKPIIHWETHTEPTWNDAFEYLHSEWDDKLGKEFIDKWQDTKEFWNSPRDLERVVFEFVEDNKEDMRFSVKSAQSIVESVVWRNLPTNQKESREFEDVKNEMAQLIYDFCKNGGKMPKDNDMDDEDNNNGINSNDQEAMRAALKKGYWVNAKTEENKNGDDKKYLITVENALRDVFDPSITGVNLEMYERLVRNMVSSGEEPKFWSDKDGIEYAKKMGWNIPPKSPENAYDYEEWKEG